MVGKDVTYVVYVLKMDKKTLYTGYTSDLGRRLKEHKEGKRGAKYMRLVDSFELVYSEEYGTRSEAMRREAEVKSWSRKKKEELIGIV